MMNRRGFLGFLGAGAVAGPSIAQTVAKTAITGSSPIMSTAGVISDLDMPYPSLGYATKGYNPIEAIKRAGELKALISGETEPEEDQYSIRRRRRYLSEHNINALGSISKTQKMRMVMNFLKAAEREEMRSNWMSELLGLEPWLK
jgi:hypothetical protein